MKVALLFCVIPLAFALDMVLTTQLGTNQRVPFALVPCFIALFFLVKVMREKFTIPRLLANIGGWALTLGFMWWTLSYAEYSPSQALASGDQLATARITELKDHTGATVDLEAHLKASKHTLFVFYRGVW